MMNSKYTSGIVAIGIYLLILGLVFYYFGYHSIEKSKHFVDKNSEAISVSLAGAKAPTSHHNPKPKPKPRHTKPKPVKSQKPTKPISKPSKKVSKKPVKKIKPKKLFSNVKTSPKPRSKTAKNTTPKKSTKSKGSLQGKSSIKKGKKADKGVENRYLAGVQDKLYGWPSQPSFAGAKVVIGLTIHPNGSFEYEILQPSDNPEFNRTIEKYLKQLKSMGFGSTPGGKSYKFKVEIKAK